MQTTSWTVMNYAWRASRDCEHGSNLVHLGTGKCYTESHDSECWLDRRHWIGIYIEWIGNPNEILKNRDQKGNATRKERKKKHHPDHPDRDHPDHPDRPDGPDRPDRPDHPDHPDGPDHPHTSLILDDPGWSRIVSDADSAMLIRTFGCWFRWRWFDSMFFDPEIIRFKEKPRQWLPFYCISFSKVFCLKWCQKYTTKTNVNSRSVVPALAGWISDLHFWEWYSKTVQKNTKNIKKNYIALRWEDMLLGAEPRPSLVFRQWRSPLRGWHCYFRRCESQSLWCGHCRKNMEKTGSCGRCGMEDKNACSTMLVHVRWTKVGECKSSRGFSASERQLDIL